MNSIDPLQSEIFCVNDHQSRLPSRRYHIKGDYGLTTARGGAQDSEIFGQHGVHCLLLKGLEFAVEGYAGFRQFAPAIIDFDWLSMPSANEHQLPHKATGDIQPSGSRRTVKPQDFWRAPVPTSHALIFQVFWIIELKSFNQLRMYGLRDLNEFQFVGKQYLHLYLPAKN